MSRKFVVVICVAALSMGPVIHVAGLITPVPVALLALALPFVAGPRIARRWLMYPFIAAWAGLTLLPVLNQALPDRLILYAFLFAGLLFALFIDALPHVSLPRLQGLRNFPPPLGEGRVGVGVKNFHRSAGLGKAKPAEPVESEATRRYG